MEEKSFSGASCLYSHGCSPPLSQHHWGRHFLLHPLPCCQHFSREHSGQMRRMFKWVQSPLFLWHLGPPECHVAHAQALGNLVGTFTEFFLFSVRPLICFSEVWLRKGLRKGQLSAPSVKVKLLSPSDIPLYLLSCLLFDCFYYSPLLNCFFRIFKIIILKKCSRNYNKHPWLII